MTRVIRIDEDVWTWLQKYARPLEDSPNSVLRRIAGLDSPLTFQAKEEKKEDKPTDIHTYSSLSRRTNSGRNLQRLWKIQAKHVLYHKDGNYYNHLEKFPGALCDPNGYLIIKTEQDYLNNSFLQHGVQLHVPDGIASVPGYVRMK